MSMVSRVFIFPDEVDILSFYGTKGNRQYRWAAGRITVTAMETLGARCGVCLVGRTAGRSIGSEILPLPWSASSSSAFL